MNKITWENNCPVSTRFKDIYYNPEFGQEESQYVFIEANHLPTRWQESVSTFSICEMGFGTGLNYLNCLNLLQTIQSNKKNDALFLNFYSCELYPLDPTDMARAIQAFPEVTTWSQEMLKQYHPEKKGWQQIKITKPTSTLHLYIGDAQDMLREMITQNTSIDAWFLDGFTPANNPQMWSKSLFHQMGVLSKEGTTMSTFTAAGQVRRDLTEAGFEIKKIAGFGKKREMITGKIHESNKKTP